MSHSQSRVDTDAIELDHDSMHQDEEEFDSHDRSGLPVIPKGAPPKGDRIDLGQIQAEFASRSSSSSSGPMKRASPSQGGEFSTTATYATTGPVSVASIPLRTVATSSGAVQAVPQQLQEEEFDEDFAYQPPERRQSLKKLPRKTLFTAGFLLFVGVLFSTLGLSFLFTLGLSEALPFLIIGGIGFIPGSYVSFIIYQTWKGVPGYSYDQIPAYDD